MLDLKKIKKELVAQSMGKRHINIDVNKLYNLYDEVKEENKKLSNLYGKRKNIDISEALILKKEIKDLEEKINNKEIELDRLLRNTPNILSDDVPLGRDSHDNIVIKQHGELIHKINHSEFLLEHNFGTRLVIYNKELARLERALVQFMLDVLLKHGFTEFNVPYILPKEKFILTGHDKDFQNMFEVEKDKYLIPTGEVPLVCMGNEKRFDTNDEAWRICTVTDCFRKEAGAAGKDTKGLIRLHQFKKCEMVVFTSADNGENELNNMIKISSEMLERLEIPYRLLLLCSGDTPLNNMKTYDLEIPIGNEWREVSSISICGTYQSKNLNCKYGDELAYTLNGSALAVGRTMASFVEVHYNKGFLHIPKVLQNYIQNDKIKLS